jgi:guanylate cyclase
MTGVERLPGWLERLANLGVRSTDSEGARLVKVIFTVVALLTAFVATVWVLVYLAFGLPTSAAIPLLYQVLTVFSLILVARTKRFDFFRRSQLTMFLVFPFLLMWSLGGFANGSAVAIWSVSAPLIAIGARPWPWFGGFAVLTVISGAINDRLAESAPDISPEAVTVMFVLNFLGVAFVIFLALAYSMREREKSRIALAEKHRELEFEQEKSERLLLNVLPAPIADRLKEGKEVIADRIPNVTVLFVDIVDFTTRSRDMPPDEVVTFLNRFFGDLDDLADRLGLDKIKTLGDGYMAAGGATRPKPDHGDAVLEMALEIRDTIAGRPFAGGRLALRIGVDTGPAIGAVIGKKRFSYDLWGRTVNAASRMESYGEPGTIQVTERVFDLMKSRFEFHERGAIAVKGMGEVTTYYLLGRRGAPLPAEADPAPV